MRKGPGAQFGAQPLLRITRSIAAQRFSIGLATENPEKARYDRALLTHTGGKHLVCSGEEGWGVNVGKFMLLGDRDKEAVLDRLLLLCGEAIDVHLTTAMPLDVCVQGSCSFAQQVEPE